MIATTLLTIAGVLTGLVVLGTVIGAHVMILRDWKAPWADNTVRLSGLALLGIIWSVVLASAGMFIKYGVSGNGSEMSGQGVCEVDRLDGERSPGM